MCFQFVPFVSMSCDSPGSWVHLGCKSSLSAGVVGQCGAGACLKERKSKVVASLREYSASPRLLRPEVCSSPVGYRFEWFRNCWMAAVDEMTTFFGNGWSVVRKGWWRTPTGLGAFSTREFGACPEAVSGLWAQFPNSAGETRLGAAPGGTGGFHLALGRFVKPVGVGLRVVLWGSPNHERFSVIPPRMSWMSRASNWCFIAIWTGRRAKRLGYKGQPEVEVRVPNRTPRTEPCFVLGR
eukprot:s36_g58.t1